MHIKEVLLPEEVLLAILIATKFLCFPLAERVFI